MDANILIERARRLKALVEADINIDLRGGSRAAMDKINPANFSNERDYAQAAAAAGNSAQADALKNLNLNDPASIAKYNTPVAQPTAAQQAEWSKDATADQKADWRYGKQGAAAAPAGTTKPAAVKDPKVLSLQQKLIALGAKIQADGIMGPQTQAAMKQYGLDINGNSTAKNVAPAGHPPATVMKDTPVGQLQTGAAQNAKAASDRSATTTDPNRTSLNANIKVAQPTGPIAPTGINNGSGVGKSYQMTPDEMKAVADNGSDYDKQALSQLPGGAALATPQGQTAGGASTAYRVRTPKGAAAQNQPQESLDRILHLATYLK
jgi:hypothetical protein